MTAGKTDYELSGVHGDQLSLDPEFPVAGDTWVNRETGYLATVVAVVQRRHVHVVIRYRGVEREITPADLAEHYRRR